MTDNPTPNDIALLREANYDLLRDQLYSLTDQLDMSVEQEDHFRGRVCCYLAMHEAALAPGQHDGAADYVLVPRVPTQKMREAATNIDVDTIVAGNTRVNWEEADEIWTAMLDAAATPSGADALGDRL